jgi:hypothetical protein
MRNIIAIDEEANYAKRERTSLPLSRFVDKSIGALSFLGSVAVAVRSFLP